MHYHLTHASLDHKSPNPKQHLDQFSRFCTAHGRVSRYFIMGRPFPPQNCPFAWGDLVPHLTDGSLGPPKSTSQTYLDQFSGFCRAHNRDRLTDHTTSSVTIDCIYVLTVHKQWTKKIRHLRHSILLLCCILWSWRRRFCRWNFRIEIWLN